MVQIGSPHPKGPVAVIDVDEPTTTAAAMGQGHHVIAENAVGPTRYGKEHIG
jgi:hypothetical protein